MDQTSTLVIVVIAALALVGVAIFLTRRRREHLQRRFGPEYDRAVAELGQVGKAEAELVRREKRVAKFTTRRLDHDERRLFTGRWRTIQTQFVDRPQAAVAEADQLVAEVLRARGYPAGDVEQRQADLSVEYPHVVQDYRDACAIASRSHGGQASTDDLRRALVSYRSLFTALVGAGEPAPAVEPQPAHEPEPAQRR